MAGDRLKGLQCAEVSVPLDHDRPEGKRITLALSRAPHTAPESKGAVLLNRGGPGAYGRDLPAMFAAGMPADVAASYDWIGFDPRGVGASRPALSCDETYQNPGRAMPDPVPANLDEERAWIERARAFARSCAQEHGEMLPHMGTVDQARDIDAIRRALGAEKVGYVGYSYGAYLGAVYATMFPGRVGRMVLDSVPRPSGVWYRNNLDQNVAFEDRIRAFFGWVARRHETYRLGTTAAEVRAAYDRARDALAAAPAGGRVGPAELDGLFLADGYADRTWDAHARALSAYVVRGDAGPLRAAWNPPTPSDLNGYAVYTAVECRDGAWPRDWTRWHADAERLYRSGHRFETWSNTWYNAPCAFWEVPGGPRPDVWGSPALPPILLVQATEDAATPYEGAVETHLRFGSSRLLVQEGGGNHGITLTGDACVDGTVAAYLRSGGLPASRPGPDATCEAGRSAAAGGTGAG
ncbi:alpha/beta hydrolase [Actinomadura sp. CNU-125]|uniref:alpha/beta hydrolase n=1 Tax=Actinomadura sp. CNU-125 TaxID=1904961 RepID=UPI0009607F31|nr:alpha/beta hydrolase [Actinomadura sp. CNU-125]OLT38624.1 alpha/beta hydrolase [Actinomadura sp. CNU-125]